MKQFLLAALLLASTCLYANGKETIEGNGNVKKETRSISNVTAIASSGAFDVTLQYGSGNSITVEADENLIPYIETVVEGNELKIRVRENVNIRTKNKMKLVVPATRLTSVRLSGSGAVWGDGNFTNDGNTDFAVSGSGRIDLKFASMGTINVRVSGSGVVKLKGSPATKLTASISGSGNIDAYDVTASDVSATISGSGNVKVTANTSLNATVSGSGNVSYKGSASNVKQQTSGSGKVYKA